MNEMSSRNVVDCCAREGASHRMRIVDVTLSIVVDCIMYTRVQHTRTQVRGWLNEKGPNHQNTKCALIGWETADVVYTLLRSIFVAHRVQLGLFRDFNGNVFKSSKNDNLIYTNTTEFRHNTCGVGIYKIIVFARFEHVPVEIAEETQLHRMRQKPT